MFPLCIQRQIEGHAPASGDGRLPITDEYHIGLSLEKPEVWTLFLKNSIKYTAFQQFYLLI